MEAMSLPLATILPFQSTSVIVPLAQVLSGGLTNNYDNKCLQKFRFIVVKHQKTLYNRKSTNLEQLN